MSCDEYFSLSNLGGSSQETEIGFSTLCVSNKTKLSCSSSSTPPLS